VVTGIDDVHVTVRVYSDPAAASLEIYECAKIGRAGIAAAQVTGRRREAAALAEHIIRRRIARMTRRALHPATGEGILVHHHAIVERVGDVHVMGGRIDADSLR
jgi:hypothetical protein